VRLAPLFARRRTLWALGIVLVVLFVLVEALLLRSYSSTERTTQEFRRTTDTATAIANVQRETLLLRQAVSQVHPGDRLAPIVLQRGLVDRQLSVVAGAGSDRFGLGEHLRLIRAGLDRFDVLFAQSYGSGERARDLGPSAQLDGDLVRLEERVKETFDDEEHALYDALHGTLRERAQTQLLIAGLSAFALLMAVLLIVLLQRAIRGGFARAYGMLDRSEERYQRLVERLPAIVYELELPAGGGAPVPVYVSPQAQAMSGDAIEALLADASRPAEMRLVGPDGREIWLRDSGTVATDGPDGRQLHGLLLDVTEAKRMEGELRLSQKLEAVGQLAAGIAHEINTPTQFVGDTVSFLERSFTDLLTLQDVQDELAAAVRVGTISPELIDRVQAAQEDADLDYLRDRVPAAFGRASEGIVRVGTIVAAMREFAHPTTIDKAPVDLNRAVRNTLVVAASEYKYVADVHTELPELPEVVCNLGELNQVILNLVVNAAHAIADHVGETGERGEIRITSRCDGDDVVVSVADTGGGIPAAIADRVFDPFFTTKDVGRGTGQGLAISRTLVVERHGGTLTFDTELGRGTTFHVRLPVNVGGGV
jgi:signal transduction histidine kinase